MRNGLVSQRECDPNDPEQFMLWFFFGLLGPGNAAAVFPVSIMSKWSARAWRFGFRHHLDLQTHGYRGLPGGDFISGNVGVDYELTEADRELLRATLAHFGKRDDTPVETVVVPDADGNTEGVQTVAVPDVSHLTAEEKRALYYWLHERMNGEREDADTEDRAAVETPDEETGEQS